jgi:hypothetical protein
MCCNLPLGKSQGHHKEARATKAIEKKQKVQGANAKKKQLNL